MKKTIIALLIICLTATFALANKKPRKLKCKHRTCITSTTPLDIPILRSLGLLDD